MFFTSTFSIVPMYPRKPQVNFSLPVATAFDFIPDFTLFHFEHRAGYVLNSRVKQVHKKSVTYQITSEFS